jgi:hypothetical protein
MFKEVRDTTIDWYPAPTDKNLAFNIFSDFVLAVLPSVVISQLNLKKKIKVGLIFLMGLGVL